MNNTYLFTNGVIPHTDETSHSFNMEEAHVCAKESLVGADNARPQPDQLGRQRHFRVNKANRRNRCDNEKAKEHRSRLLAYERMYNRMTNQQLAAYQVQRYLRTSVSRNEVIELLAAYDAKYGLEPPAPTGDLEEVYMSLKIHKELGVLCGRRGLATKGPNKTAFAKRLRKADGKVKAPFSTNWEGFGGKPSIPGSDAPVDVETTKIQEQSCPVLHYSPGTTMNQTSLMSSYSGSGFSPFGDPPNSDPETQWLYEHTSRAKLSRSQPGTYSQLQSPTFAPGHQNPVQLEPSTAVPQSVTSRSGYSRHVPLQPPSTIGLTAPHVSQTLSMRQSLPYGGQMKTAYAASQLHLPAPGYGSPAMKDASAPPAPYPAPPLYQNNVLRPIQFLYSGGVSSRGRPAAISGLLPPLQQAPRPSHKRSYDSYVYDEFEEPQVKPWSGFGYGAPEDSVSDHESLSKAAINRLWSNRGVPVSRDGPAAKRAKHEHQQPEQHVPARSRPLAEASAAPNMAIRRMQNASGAPAARVAAAFSGGMLRQQPARLALGIRRHNLQRLKAVRSSILPAERNVLLCHQYHQEAEVIIALHGLNNGGKREHHLPNDGAVPIDPRLLKPRVAALIAVQPDASGGGCPLCYDGLGEI